MTTVAVPELTHPGESQTNGLAERSARTLEEQIRTMVAALESRVQTKVPSEHAVLTWVVEHACYILNKYGRGVEGKTPYSLLHGKQTPEQTRKFGEHILWFVPTQCGRSLARNGNTEYVGGDP